MVRLFHVSSAANRKSILAHGLDWTRMGAARGIAGSTTPEQEGVFLCRDEACGPPQGEVDQHSARQPPGRSHPRTRSATRSRLSRWNALPMTASLPLPGPGHDCRSRAAVDAGLAGYGLIEVAARSRGR